MENMGYQSWLVLQEPVLNKYPTRLSVTSYTCFFGLIQFLIIVGIAFVVQIWCIGRGGPIFISVYQALQTLTIAIMASFALGKSSIWKGFYLVLWDKSQGRKFATQDKRERLLTGGMQSPLEMIVDEDGSLIPNEAYDDFVAQDNTRIYLGYGVAILCNSVFNLGHIASILKGLPYEYQPFMAVITSSSDMFPLDKLILLMELVHMTTLNGHIRTTIVNEYPLLSHVEDLVVERVEDVAGHTFNYSCMCSSKGSRLHALTSAYPSVAENDRWVVDSSVTHHVTPDTDNITHRTGRSGPGKLVVGDGVSLAFDLVGCCVRYAVSGEVILQGRMQQGLYVFASVTTSSVCKNACVNYVVADDVYSLWHRTLGHAAYDTIASGGEYRNLSYVLLKDGIVHCVVCPHTSEQNGVAKRKYRHIIKLALVLLAQIAMPLRYWYYTDVTAIFLFNRLLIKVLDGLSPHEKLWGKKPYPQHKGYMCLAASGKIYVYRHKSTTLELISDMRQFQTDRTGAAQEMCSGGMNQADLNEGVAPLRVAVQQEVVSANEGSFDKGSDHMEQATVDMSDTSLGDAVQQEEGGATSVSTTKDVEPVSQVQPVAMTDSFDNVSPPLQITGTRDGNNGCSLNQHSMQTRRKCGIFKPKLYLASCDDMKRVNVYEALQSSHCRIAVHEEVEDLRKNGTWNLVKLPEGRLMVGCKWFSKLKKNPDGSISRYKARLVGKGLSQVTRHDFGETFNPFVKFAMLNVVLSLAIMNGWQLRQLDVNNAFLNGDLHEEVFMQQPPRFEQVATDGSPLIEEVVRLFGTEFALNDLGDLHYFLGIEVKRCGSSLILSQRKFILELLMKTKMSIANPASSPMLVSSKLNQGAGVLLQNAYEYRSIVGTINHGLVIAHAVAGFNEAKVSFQVYYEAEYKSVVDVTAETTWMNALLTYLRVARQRVPIVWCDNNNVVAMKTNPVYHAKSKHVELDDHFVPEKVTLKQVVVNYVSGSHQVADGFIKPLAAAQFEVFKARVNVQSFLGEKEEEVERMFNDEDVADVCRIVLDSAASFILSIAEVCIGGRSTSFVRNDQLSRDMPLNSHVFRVHITQGDHLGKAVIVSWVTPDEPGSSSVLYLSENSKLKNSAQGTVLTYKYFNYTSGYIHHCTMEDLEFDTKFYYEVGIGKSSRRFCMRDAMHFGLYIDELLCRSIKEGLTPPTREQTSLLRDPLVFQCPQVLNVQLRSFPPSSTGANRRESLPLVQTINRGGSIPFKPYVHCHHVPIEHQGVHLLSECISNIVNGLWTPINDPYAPVYITIGDRKSGSISDRDDVATTKLLGLS
ncbi:hypothetical protein F3Y22_tig00110239pilonHSYRG00255 [Hibiscus syriacus]|uniref:acid phosphatase n=1 Tax=Hibiscus syriacus TaxID=106335 RepID=A0A6A3B9I9_HIBSY|nr:hypothetical protein F3Y22_tig00110239pilonHSYRG00255 [Hibiscus syriacus]